MNSFLGLLKNGDFVKVQNIQFEPVYTFTKACVNFGILSPVFKRWQFDVVSLPYHPRERESDLNLEVVRSTFQLQFSTKLSESLSRIVETLSFDFDLLRQASETVQICAFVSETARWYLGEISFYLKESDKVADQHGLLFPFLCEFSDQLFFTFIKRVLEQKTLSWDLFLQDI